MDSSVDMALKTRSSSPLLPVCTLSIMFLDSVILPDNLALRGTCAEGARGLVFSVEGICSSLSSSHMSDIEALVFGEVFPTNR